MSPFYQSDARRRLLSVEAQRWIGTPFRYGSAVPGPLGGVDCVGLCAAMHVACGVCAAFDIKRLPLSWHIHHEASGILEFFAAPGVRERVRQMDPEDERMAGDLVVIKTERCEHHLGLHLADALGTHLLHVPLNGTVQRWSYESRALRGRVAGLWRIMEAVA